MTEVKNFIDEAWFIQAKSLSTRHYKKQMDMVPGHKIINDVNSWFQNHYQNQIDF